MYVVCNQKIGWPSPHSTIYLDRCSSACGSHPYVSSHLILSYLTQTQFHPVDPMPCHAMPSYLLSPPPYSMPSPPIPSHPTSPHTSPLKSTSRTYHTQHCHTYHTYAHIELGTLKPSEKESRTLHLGILLSCRVYITLRYFTLHYIIAAVASCQLVPM